MKHFVIKSFVFLLVAALLSLLVAANVSLTISNKISLMSHECNVSKQRERLSTLRSPKMIIIGGSNCGFGILSPMLEEHFCMPVSNTGVHGGIGLRMQIKLLSDYIDSGDIVLVIPEYEQFLENGYLGDETLIRILTTHCPEAYTMFSFRQWIHVIPYFYKNVFRANNPIDSISPYSSYSVTKQGDVDNCIKEHQTVYDLDKYLSKDIQPESASVISVFQNRCITKGAVMYLIPPVYNSLHYQKDVDVINTIDSMLSVSGIPYVVPTSRYSMNDTLFFDTKYHLTHQGAYLRTQLLIEDIDSLNLICQF